MTMRLIQEPADTSIPPIRLEGASGPVLCTSLEDIKHVVMGLNEEINTLMSREEAIVNQGHALRSRVWELEQAIATVEARVKAAYQKGWDEGSRAASPWDI